MENLLSMANMPWEIARNTLPDSRVEYRLLIPPEDNGILQGSPTIVMSPEAAEKADLLILSIRGDQKLLEKWHSRTLTP